MIFLPTTMGNSISCPKTLDQIVRACWISREKFPLSKFITPRVLHGFELFKLWLKATRSKYFCDLLTTMGNSISCPKTLDQIVRACWISREKFPPSKFIAPRVLHGFELFKLWLKSTRSKYFCDLLTYHHGK